MENMKEQIRQMLDEETRRDIVDSCLNRLGCETDVGAFFARYAAFNSPFAGAVACLAGQIHFRTDLFRSRDGNISEDRSAEIASRVFYAAEDEYSALDKAGRITHRSIAQAFVAEINRIVDPNNRHCLADLDRSSDVLDAFKIRVKAGYATQGFGDSADAIRALAFHAGSELFADIEFNHIQAFMRRRYPRVVADLSERKGPGGVGGFYWITVHSEVEAIHGDMAVEALDLAYQYGSAELRRGFSETVAEGFQSFSTLYRDFFGWAASSLETTCTDECAAARD